MFIPLLVAVNAVPKITIGPLLVVALGWGQTPILTMVFLLCFFPIVLSTATGLTTTPADLAELARSLDASCWQTFRKVRFPAAVPQIFVGLKVAMPLAAIGAVIGEFQAGEGGLGYVITQYAGMGDTATAWAAIMLVGADQHRALFRRWSSWNGWPCRGSGRPPRPGDLGRPVRPAGRPGAAVTGAGRTRRRSRRTPRQLASRQRPPRATRVVRACGISPEWLSGVIRIGPGQAVQLGRLEHVPQPVPVRPCRARRRPAARRRR